MLHKYLLITLIILIVISKGQLLTKNNTNLISLLNITKEIQKSNENHPTTLMNVEQKNETEYYTKWSKWSTCRKCKKIRRKICISKKCNNSILTEEKPCSTKRCKRKFMYKRRKYLNVLQKIETKDYTEPDWLYTKWSDWTPCSVQCITWRDRLCKFPGTCFQSRDVQMGYCYTEQSACHKWIQGMVNRQNKRQKYTNNNNNNNDVDAVSTTKKPKKVKYKANRKCGIPYRTNKSRYNVRNLLKIMGGNYANPGKWPWQVALLNYRKEVFCGGTLIASNWVLTAAHCLRNSLTVRLNEFDLQNDEGNEIEYKIWKMYPHYMYNKNTIDNDIALLKLPRTVALPYACLPKNIALPTKQNCTIVGWGRRSPYDARGSKYLKEAQIPIVPKQVCKRSYRHYDITSNMFCAGFKHGGTDTCSGDSGGGFMCLPKGKKFGWTVQGITSFGEGCGRKGKYGIYTDVRKYLRWIHKTIN